MKSNIYKTGIIIFFLLFSSNYVRAQMFWNQACSFAGTGNSYIAGPNNALINISGSFTLEAWVNPVNSTLPTFQMILQKRNGGNPVGYSLYLNNGKVAIRTNAVTRLIGKTVLSNNVWTHIAGTYNSGTGAFGVYINGALDTSTIIGGAPPVASTDSLFIGEGFNSPFTGVMDEVRIWNRALSSTEVSQYRRTSLGTDGGVYTGLAMSLTFQDNESSGVYFSLLDWTGNGVNLFNRGVTAFDMSDRPLQTISINESIELDGTNDYMAAPDNPANSPSNVLTIEAWIYPVSISENNLLVHKGTDDGFTTDYRLSLANGKLQSMINNKIVLTSDDDIPSGQWSHVAFVSDGVNGVNLFYLNGKQIDAGINDKGFIIDGADSLYIGGTIALEDFNGFIDEVKITLGAKPAGEINQAMFRSTDESNDGPFSEIVYNLDGYAVSSVGGTNRLSFRNAVNFSHSGAINNTPLSPINRSDALNFQEGFILKTSDRRIPETGTLSGRNGSMLEDTIDVLLDETIADVNLFVATNHTAEQNMIITLTAPNGQSVTVFNSNSLVTNADNLVTIFDDQADSSIVNGRFVSFSPSIRPSSNLNVVFGGDNAFGKWILSIDDASAGDTGRLYGWGIQINNKTSNENLLYTSALVEGFYNPVSNLMIRDTVRFRLRSSFAPFDVIDLAQANLSPGGTATLQFSNAVPGILYYIELDHRNSIETWSSTFISFDPLTSQAEYHFVNEASSAYGDNMVQVDDVPVKYAIYGGDVNKDQTVDLSDITLIYNDANIFAGGYIITDVTGDDYVDLSDVVLAFNNAANFVSAEIPVAD